MNAQLGKARLTTDRTAIQVAEALAMLDEVQELLSRAEVAEACELVRRASGIVRAIETKART